LLRLEPRTRDEVKSTLESMSSETRALISADWWAQFQASAYLDPWVHGFNLFLADGTNVGIGSFKGPPVDGAVEIAYAIVPEHQGRGYATAAAREMAEYAFRTAEVRTVRGFSCGSGHRL